MSNIANRYSGAIIVYDDYIRGKTPDEKLFIEIMDDGTIDDNLTINKMLIVLSKMYSANIHNYHDNIPIYRIAIKSDVIFKSHSSFIYGGNIYTKNFNQIEYSINKGSAPFGEVYLLSLRSQSYDKIIEIFKNKDYLIALVENFQEWIDKENPGHIVLQNTLAKDV